MMREEIDEIHETGCLLVMVWLVLLVICAVIVAFLLLK